MHATKLLLDLYEDDMMSQARKHLYERSTSRHDIIGYVYVHPLEDIPILVTTSRRDRDRVHTVAWFTFVGKDWVRIEFCMTSNYLPWQVMRTRTYGDRQRYEDDLVLLRLKYGS